MTPVKNILSALILISAANQLTAADSLRLELGVVAKDVKAFIDDRPGDTISVGGFGEPADALGSGSPSIQLQLSDALQAAGIKVAESDAAFQIQGSYSGRIDKDDLLGVRIALLLSDSKGNILKLFQRDVFGAETVPALMGISVHNNPNDSNAEKHRKFGEKLKEPDVHVIGNKITTSPNSLYAVEVLVKKGSFNGKVDTQGGASGYEAQTATTTKDKKGRPFVGINVGEVFAVRLINNHPTHEAAVNLTLDGINCFQFSDIKSRYWIVPPKSNVVIRGWHKNNDTSIEFKRTEFPESAAAKPKLKPSQKIGLISAAFSAAWPKDADPPSDERTRAAGFGDEIQFKTRQVARNIGQLRDNIVVRYERTSN